MEYSGRQPAWAQAILSSSKRARHKCKSPIRMGVVCSSWERNKATGKKESSRHCITGILPRPPSQQAGRRSRERVAHGKEKSSGKPPHLPEGAGKEITAIPLPSPWGWNRESGRWAHRHNTHFSHMLEVYRQGSRVTFLGSLPAPEGRKEGREQIIKAAEGLGSCGKGEYTHNKATVTASSNQISSST